MGQEAIVFLGIDKNSNSIEPQYKFSSVIGLVDVLFETGVVITLGEKKLLTLVHGAALNNQGEITEQEGVEPTTGLPWDAISNAYLTRAAGLTADIK